MNYIESKVNAINNENFHYVYNIQNSVDGNYAENITNYFSNYTIQDFIEIIEKRKQVVFNFNYSLKLKFKELEEGDLTDEKGVENTFLNKVIISFNQRFEELQLEAKEQRNKKMFMFRSKSEKNNIKKFITLSKNDVVLSLKSQIVFKHIKLEETFVMPESLEFLKEDNVFVLAKTEYDGKIVKEDFFLEKESLEYFFDESILFKNEKNGDLLKCIGFNFNLYSKDERIPKLGVGIKFNYNEKTYQLSTFYSPQKYHYDPYSLLGSFIPEIGSLFLNEKELENEISIIKHKMSMFIKNN